MFDQVVETLTPRQREVYEVVRSHLVENGYPPTVREIGDRLGLASSSTVHAHLSALERAGILRRDPSKPRAITLAGVDTADTNGRAGDTPVMESLELPLVGRVAAGEPILADGHVEEYLPVPGMLAGPGESFLLRIVGDSMVGAGILDGDYVVVRRQPSANEGEIVVALVDDEPEATCKRLRRSGSRVELVPENPNMSPIIPESCDIVGIVTGVFRAI